MEMAGCSSFEEGVYLLLAATGGLNDEWRVRRERETLYGLLVFLRLSRMKETGW